VARGEPLPTQLEDIVLRAMARDVTRRPTAAHLAEQLGRFTRGEP
jgi:hypothetical protein